MEALFEPFEILVQKALKLGASDAGIISVRDISVEEELAKLCETPPCEGYGQSASCPPHVMKPDRFRKHLTRYENALVFKIDVPMEMLMGNERQEVARFIHEVSASIEQYAVGNGYPDSKGLAAGSCKQLFCSKYKNCRVTGEKSACRFPDLARPSMSGLGINFNKLTRKLGWENNRKTGAGDTSTGMMAGMVLLKNQDSAIIKSTRSKGVSRSQTF